MGAPKVGFLLEQVEKETRGALANPGLPEKNSGRW